MANIVPAYFFLNNKLYKRLAVVKSENYVVVFSYSDETKMRFPYDLIRKTHSKAFTAVQTANILGRSLKEVMNLIHRNLVPRPSGRSYHLSSKRPDKWYWSEEDVLTLRDAMYENSKKNKYGQPTIRLKSKSEVLAEMHGDDSYYMKTEDGTFVKVWKAV